MRRIDLGKIAIDRTGMTRRFWQGSVNHDFRGPAGSPAWRRADARDHRSVADGPGRGSRVCGTSRSALGDEWDPVALHRGAGNDDAVLSIDRIVDHQVLR